MGADPLAGEHLARGDDDCLLVVGVEVRLHRVADQHDRASLELGVGRAFDRVDVRHRHARPLARVGVKGRADGIELPQLLDQLAAERVARAESADAIVRPRPRLDPGLQPRELGEIGARRMRTSRGRGEARAAPRRRAASASRRPAPPPLREPRRGGARRSRAAARRRARSAPGRRDRGGGHRASGPAGTRRRRPPPRRSSGAAGGGRSSARTAARRREPPPTGRPSRTSRGVRRRRPRSACDRRRTSPRSRARRDRAARRRSPGSKRPASPRGRAKRP